MTTNEFYERMIKLTKTLTRIDHFSAFLWHCILNEIYLLNLTAPVPQGKYLKHPLPLKHPNFPYHPIKIDHTDSIYERELEEYARWIREGNSVESYWLHQKKRLAGKKSLLVQKILSCAMDFARHVEKISRENDIPASSLTTILTTMTHSAQKYSPPSNAAGDQGNDFMPRDHFSLNILATDILISADVPAGCRDRRILSAAKMLYDLFQEAFWVLMVSGLTDLMNTHVFARYNNLDNIKKYLLDRACFVQMEERVREIKTLSDFQCYILEEMVIFGFVFKEYSTLCRNYIRKFANDRIELSQTTSSISLEQYEISMKGGDAFKAADDLHDRHIEKMSYEKSNPDAEFVEASSSMPYSSDNFYARPFLKNAEGSHKHIDYASGIRRKNITDTGQDKFTGYEKMVFEYDILFESESRLFYEPMKEYKLRGRPENLIKYIRGIIDNRSLDLIHDNYNRKTKETFRRSTKTLQRIEKEEKDRKRLEDPAYARRRGRTLSDDETKRRIKEREDRRAHKLEGHWNREELIDELRKASKIQEAKNNGIQLKIYSRTTLVKRITEAVGKGLIKPEKEGRYYYFKFEDFLMIARAIA